MKLYINKDQNTIVNDPKFNYPIDSIAFKRGDSATVEIIFCSNSSPLSAVDDIELQFGIKESGKYDGDYIVYAEDYTKSENSYVMNPNFSTVPLNTLLNSGDSNDSNDVGSVSLMLEISWSNDAGTNWYSSNTITAVVNNDVNKGGESAPVESRNFFSPVLSLSARPYGTGEAITFQHDYNDVVCVAVSTANDRPYYTASFGYIVSLYDGNWIIKYDDYTTVTILISSYQDSPTPDLVNTWFTIWPSNDPSDPHPVYPYGFVSGVLGQDAIVNNADVYKCVQDNPVKWTKLN